MTWKISFKNWKDNTKAKLDQTRALNQAVKRNIEKFPQDFMFRLTLSEARFPLLSFRFHP